MKRRTFIARATGATALFYVGTVSGAVPCPPRVSGSDGQPPCPAPTGDSSLATLAGQLEPGQSASFASGNQSRFSQNDLEWQSNFYHDASNGRIHLLGKPANANTSWRHQYFTTSTDTWTDVSSGIDSWDYYGHIYGNTAFDENSGDLYQTVGISGDSDSKRAWRYRHSTGAWDRRAPGSGTYTSTALNDTCNGAAWHPNLYGPNDGGLVVDQQVTTLYWRQSTDAMQEAGHSSNAYGRKEGVGIYWPAQDAVIVGGSTGDALAKVTPNGGSKPVRTTLNTPPISTSGQSSLGSNFGSLHVHPGNPNKLLIVESVGQRAYTSIDGNNWVRIADHPFTRFPRVVCSLRAGLGCLWAIGNDGSNFSRLWKPEP